MPATPAKPDTPIIPDTPVIQGTPVLQDAPIEYPAGAPITHRFKTQAPAPPVGAVRKKAPRCGARHSSADSRLFWLVVIALSALVHVTGLSQTAFAVENDKPAAQAKSTSEKVAPEKAASEIRRPLRLEDLPLPVREMRDLILAAVETGDIDELRHALEWNELRPDLGIDRDADAIEHFRETSVDGNGTEILARLGDMLSTPPAILPVGPDLENNNVFVWPYLAEKPLKSLTPKELVDLYRIVPAEVAKQMVASGKWSWYRLVIGADGTWHAFVKFN